MRTQLTLAIRYLSRRKLRTLLTTLAVVLGYGFTAMLAAAMVPSMSFSFPLNGPIATVAIALLMAVVASLLPARQAAGLRIVQALRCE